MLSTLVGTFLALALVVGGVGGFEYWKTARQFQKVQTGAGQTISVEMPDGSTATLGPKSELKYLKGMWSQTGPDRLVWPRGEVTFHVRKVEWKMGGGAKRLSIFRITTPQAWVTIRTGALVKVEAPGTETSVEMLEGDARMLRHTPDDAPVGEAIELPAGYGGRTTVAGVRVYPLPRAP